MAGIPRIKAMNPKHLIFALEPKYGLQAQEAKYQFATHNAPEAGCQEIEKNTLENIWAYVWDAHAAGDVTLDAVTFEVFDAEDVSVQASDTGTIVDNGTATPDFYGLVDTTAAAFAAGSSYYVRFTITIGTEIRFYDVWFTVT